MNTHWSRMPDWNQLTHDPQKHRHYPAEFEYRLVWEDLQYAFANRAEQVLQDYTFLGLKPECFRRRVSGRVLDYLVQAGFTLVDAEIRHIPPADENYIWRFQWNTATNDRLRLINIKNRGEVTAILLLRRPASEHGQVPASVHLASLKGSSAYVERRQAHDLRTILDIPNRALTFIHCPDEPADVMRECVSLFPDTTRVIDRLREGRDDTRRIVDLVLAHEQTVAHHSVRYAEVAERRALHIDTSRKLPLDDIRPLFGDLGNELERWDFVSVAAEHIRHDRTDEGPVISTRFLPQIFDSWSTSATRPIKHEGDAP